jgi:glyoxylase I family protein
MEAEVIGIDHVYLSVRDLAAGETFYDTVLVEVLGFRKGRFALGGDPHVQYYNRQFGFVIRPARAGAATAYDSGAPGLHHFCFRVATEHEVDRVAGALRARGVDATAAQLYPDYAPDYRATFFHDPDGVRLEVTNFRAERRERMTHWQPNGDAAAKDGAAREADVSLSEHIRLATLDDCGPIAALIGDLASEENDRGPGPGLSVTEATIRSCIGVTDHQILVAADGARLAGYIAVHWIPLPMLSASEGYVSDLFLARSYRGAGLGRRLLGAVERLASQRGCARLMLNNRVTSPSFTRGFYPKLGFRRRDEFANFVKPVAGDPKAET